MAKIAIIEDDKAISEMYRLKFEGDGNKVFVADNGKDGFELIKENKPEIILCDLMMPIMTGDELIRKVRATDWGKDMRIYILTNVSKDDAIHKLKDIKVDGYVVKAFYTPQEVVDLVLHALPPDKN